MRWRLSPTGAARGRTIRESVIVQVIRPSGAIGYGEAAPLAPRDSIGQVLRALDGARVDSPSVRFAIEIAELDAFAREIGVPLASVLGAKVTSLPTAIVVDTPVSTTAACIKIKVGPDGDVERVRRISAAAPHASLRIDANRSWPRERVHAYMTALAGLPIEFVEEPCVDAHTLGPMPLPIALDESLVDDIDWSNAAALVLKPSMLGLVRCRELAARARDKGIAPIVTHGLEGPIGTSACAAFALAVGGDRAVGLGPHPALDAWEMPVPHLEADRICAIAAPGLGIDTDALEDAIVALRDPFSIRTTLVTDERTIIATPDEHTIERIHAALDRRRAIGLVNHKLPAAEQARQRELIENADLAEGDVVLFTSGSTAAARGVVLSRDALIAATEANAAHLGWADDDRWLLALSMAHSGGLAVVVRCLAAGRSVVLPTPSLADALAHCTLASLVPTQLAQLLDDPAWLPPPHLRAILLGGAAASPALLAAAAERGVPFLTTYGMTESFGQVATAPLDRAGHPGAPLVPLANVTIEAGTFERPTPIRVRSPSLARRYLDGERIAPVLTTADLGYLDGGILRIVGRADDVIITGGENVHPAAVEDVLAATPGIRAACVFGVADERWGQRVAAAIVVEATFDLAHAIAVWQDALPSFARPREIAIIDGLPLLANGKVDRRAASTLPRRRL